MANDITDYLVRIITGNGTLRALACVTTGLVSDACRRHHTLPTASTALGRALTGGALMGALLKTGERLALRFEGNGPLKKILVEADSNGAVRGCVGVPEVDLPLQYGRLDVAGALGRAGFLTVTKDLGMKEPYQGVVQLYTSEIAEDLAYFFTESEQTPSAVGLGVFLEPDGAIGAAGGFLIQSLPPQDEELVERLMTAIKALPPVSDMLRNGATPEQLLERLFGDVSFTVLEKRALAFVCSCSRERIERVLLSLGRKELTDMLEKDGKAAVTCEFCRETYDFSKLELEQLLESGAIEVSS